MKLCKDCKWASKHGHKDWTEFTRCGHALAYRPNFVGHAAPEAYCQTERECGKCGPEGKHFEPRLSEPEAPPKRSIFQRLFA